MRISRIALTLAAMSFVSADAGIARADSDAATELQRAPKRKPTRARKKKPKQKLTHALRKKVAALRARQLRIRAAATTLRDLSRTARPRNLPAKDRKMWPKFVGFLRASNTQIARAATGWKVKLDGFDKKLNKVDASGASAQQLMRATKEMQEMNNSFNLQYLTLQQDMQSQNRQFTTISNVMKTKHDTAKNAINNVR